MHNTMRLRNWERGVRLESRSDPNLFAFLWFYEWHLFDAVKRGEHTHGAYDWDWCVNENGADARMDADWLRLDAQATTNGATLTLEIANNTDHDWPAIAAVIPCFNPGDHSKPATRNSLFLDEEHIHTYFQGKNGLESLRDPVPRAIHFNHDCRSDVMSWHKERQDGHFVFDKKWPTSEHDAFAGIMIRESSDERYVMGIGWDSFLSAQAHNPWNCMHLSVKVGPLAVGRKKTIRGRIYLFEGSKADCIQAFENDLVSADR